MTFDFGQSMSQPMQAAVAEVVEHIQEELTGDTQCEAFVFRVTLILLSDST